MKITNLRTNQVFTIDERHAGMFAGNEQYLRFLLAASYCPVVDKVWNARCGAYLRNVVFDHVQIARYNESDVYTAESLMDFYPGINMSYGFSQAADGASMIYGKNQRGEKMISFSCYYDGGSHYDK